MKVNGDYQGQLLKAAGVFFFFLHEMVLLLLVSL